VHAVRAIRRSLEWPRNSPAGLNAVTTPAMAGWPGWGGDVMRVESSNMLPEGVAVEAVADP